MSARPLACTQCGGQCCIAEDVESCIDWGPGVIGDDGIARPQYPDDNDGHQSVDHGVNSLRIRAVCTSPACGHQWTLRRRFDPTDHATEEPRP